MAQARISMVLLIFLLSPSPFPCVAAPSADDGAGAETMARSVTIYRDSYGVPHIHGPSDASVIERNAESVCHPGEEKIKKQADVQPKEETWIDRPKVQWPRIALSNSITYTHKHFPVAACGFLIDTRYGVYAVSAKHVLKFFRSPEMDAVHFKGTLKKWVMSPKDSPGDVVVVDRLVNEDATESIDKIPTGKDWLIFSVKERSEKIQPLKLRTTPLEGGEKIYVTGWRYTEKDCPQLVYEGRYVKPLPGAIVIDIKALAENKVPGLSGSPVFDGDGLVIGIMSSGYGKMQKAASTDYVEKILGESRPAAPEKTRHEWPRFRGPGGLGKTDHAKPPTEWNGKGSKTSNILWKAPIPRAGHSSPVVWGDRVFVTGYDAEAHKGEVYCYDASKGTLAWRKRIDIGTPSDQSALDVLYDDAVGAASTMATDGTLAFAIFANGDLAALDFDGRLVWSKQLGAPRSTYGYAASPALHKKYLLVQFDEQPESKDVFRSILYAFDTATGEIAWRKKRPVADSWTSPIVIDTGKGSQIVTVADPWVIAYDPADGGEIWRVAMEGPDQAPSPTFGGGLVFSIVPNYDMFAIRPDGKGDVSKTHIAWVADRDIPEICSPAASDELIFLLCDGFVTCHDIDDGKRLWEKELDSNFQSSPTIVGDRLYLLGTEGTMFILAAKGTYVEIGRAELGERSTCSPAFVGERIYIRGEKHLFCIGEKR